MSIVGWVLVGLIAGGFFTEAGGEPAKPTGEATGADDPGGKPTEAPPDGTSPGGSEAQPPASSPLPAEATAAASTTAGG